MILNKLTPVVDRFFTKVDNLLTKISFSKILKILLFILCLYFLTSYCFRFLFTDFKFRTTEHISIIIAVLIISFDILKKNPQIKEIVCINNSFIQRITHIILIIIIIFLIFLPLFAKKNINEESVINYNLKLSEDYLQKFKKDESFNSLTTESQANRFFQALLNPNASMGSDDIHFLILDENFKYINLIKAITRSKNLKNEITNILYPEIVILNDINYIKTRLDGVNIQNICFFLNSEKTTFTNCIKLVNQMNKIDVIQFINNNTDEEISKKLIYGINKVIERETYIKEVSGSLNLNMGQLLPILTLYNSSKRGIYFHHYHSLIEKTFNLKSYSQLFESQYGLGPQIFISLIKEVFNIKVYDAILLSIVISNAYVLILILAISCYLKKQYNTTNLLLPLLGFIFFYSFIYFSIENIAPSLYPLRYLPHITLVLLSLLIFKITKPYSVITTILLYSLYMCSIFYNFEYGFIIYCAASMAFILIKKYLYFVFISVPIMGFFVLKIALGTDKSNNNLIFYYLSGIGFDGSVNINFIIISISLLILIFVFNKYCNFQNNIEMGVTTFLLYFFSFSLIKGFWSATLPQISSSILFLYIYFLSLSIINFNYLKINSIKIPFKYIHISISVILIISLFNPLKNYVSSINNSNLGLKYDSGVVSNIYQTDSRLTDKINELLSLQKPLIDKISLLSPNDSFFSLYFEKSINSPYSDLSTFLISNNDVNNAFNYIIKSKVPYIVVDKNLNLNYNNLVPVQTEYLKINDSNLYNLKFQLHLYDLYAKLINSNLYNFCGETKSFLKFCINE
jgi:hypothetical protein